MRVLLVDDNDPLRVVVRRTLEHEGLTVVAEGKDGVHALDLLEIGSGSVDVVVLDGQMPRMDGVLATREIRARYPGVAVIGYTADPVAGNLMVDNGALAYILKGNPATELVEAIYRVATNIDDDEEQPRDSRDAEPT